MITVNAGVRIIEERLLCASCCRSFSLQVGRFTQKAAPWLARVTQPEQTVMIEVLGAGMNRCAGAGCLDTDLDIRR